MHFCDPQAPCDYFLSPETADLSAKSDDWSCPKRTGAMPQPCERTQQEHNFHFTADRRVAVANFLNRLKTWQHVLRFHCIPFGAHRLVGSGRVAVARAQRHPLDHCRRCAVRSRFSHVAMAIIGPCEVGFSLNNILLCNKS